MTTTTASSNNETILNQALSALVQYDAGEVFTGKKSGNPVVGWGAPTPFTPAIDPNYMFTSWTSDIALWLRMKNADPLYVFGPTGCGKTSCIKQVVAKLNYPVFEVTGHERMEFPEMVGHHTVQGGNMQYAYGPLALAMKYGGLFLLNEIDLLDPSTAAGLNSVLDGSPLTIPENGGEVIYPHGMFKFIATANSNGTSDSTGLYQGVLRQNLAFMDRFTMARADYLQEKTEAFVVWKHAPSLAPEFDPADKSKPMDEYGLIPKMVAYANAVRKLFRGEKAENVDTQIDITLSTRTIIRWALLIVEYEPLKAKKIDVVQHALDRALLFRATGVTQQVLEELKQRMFGGA